MPYIKEWQTLNEALQRLLAAGQGESDAKRDLCNAISDRAIEVRVHCAGDDVLPGGRVNVPARIDPDSLSWPSSRPFGQWELRPVVADRYFPKNLRIDVELLELRCDDVTQVLLDGNAQARLPPVESRQLRTAPDGTIRKAIRNVYEQRCAQSGFAPNLVDTAPLVQRELEAQGYTASGRRIQEIASADEFKSMRRPSGKRTLER